MSEIEKTSNDKVDSFFEYIKSTIPEKEYNALIERYNNPLKKIDGSALNNYRENIKDFAKCLDLIEDIFENKLLKFRSTNQEETNQLMSHWKNYLKNYVMGSSSLLGSLVNHLKESDNCESYFTSIPIDIERIGYATKKRLNETIKNSSNEYIKNQYKENINNTVFVPIVLYAGKILSIMKEFKLFLEQLNNMFDEKTHKTISNDGHYVFKSNHIIVRIKPFSGRQESHIRIKQRKSDNFNLRLDNPIHIDKVQFDFGSINPLELINSLEEYLASHKLENNDHGSQEFKSENKSFSSIGAVISRRGLSLSKQVPNMETHHYTLPNSEKYSKDEVFVKIAKDVIKTLGHFRGEGLKIIGKIELP